MSGVTSSAAPTGGQKLSMLAAKSGFVIPKNKLSGSLVPIYRGSRVQGATGATNVESSKQMHRKTKWGPDLTQDAAVKKGRALALQIRVDQITQQLKLRKLDAGDMQDSSLVAKHPEQSYNSSPIDDKKSEMLELEKREAIGEILRLDPSYKPPPGFKPLLKEASVSLPVKEYPGVNFTGLIYGPEGDNQIRLEKETGAKIQIHGVKAGEKDEIKPGNNVPCTHEEMHVNVSADSFEKVDAAVSIIELLITSITGNLAAASATATSVSGVNTSVRSQSEDGPLSHPISMGMEGLATVQPLAGVTHMHGDHFQYPGPWFSTVSSHNSVFGSTSNIGPTNPTDLSRPLHFSSQSMNSSNMASTFAAQPAPVAGFNSVFPNRAVVSLQSQPTREHFQHSHMGPPRNPSVVPIQIPSAPTNAQISFPVNGSQLAPVGQLQQLVPSNPQPLPGISPVPGPDRSLAPFGVSSGLGGVSLGLTNTGHLAPSLATPPPRPVSLQLQPDVAFKPPVPNISMASRSSFPPHQAGIPHGLPSSLGPMQPSIPTATYPSVNHLSGSVSFPSPKILTSHQLSQQSRIPNPNSASGATYQTQVKPPLLSMSPSNSGNFTFQPQQPNADFQMLLRPNTAIQGGPKEQSSGSRPPSFGFAAPDRPVNQIFPRTQVPNQLDQTQAAAYTVPFQRGPGAAVPIARGHTGFPFTSQPPPRSPAPQMGMRSFFPSPQMPNYTTHIQQNHPPQRWPDIHMPPNQKFGNNHSVASGKLGNPADVIYDPFSPTSVAPPQQKK